MFLQYLCNPSYILINSYTHTHIHYIGVKHWLQHAHPPIPTDIIIGLIDPDFIFLRPLTHIVQNDPALLYNPLLASEMLLEASLGHPVGQL